MKKKRTCDCSKQLKINIASNVVLGALVLSIGALCVAPINQTMQADANQSEIYLSATKAPKGVSLMFNVYWGTEEVYEIINILKRFDAKATFFIGGSWADDNVECLRAIDEAGHEIGNHGYFHKDHSKMSVENNRKEIEQCNTFIRLSIGKTPQLFAPPSGAYCDDMLVACKQLDMTTIMWSKDTIDWRDKDASLIYTRATKNIKTGDFVLMHPMKATVDALDDILSYYDSQALSCVTVGENLRDKQG